MLYAIDIDGTLAKDFHNAARRAYVARVLSLPTDGDALYTWLRSADNLQKYQKAYDGCACEPVIMRALSPIPGSVDALQVLANQGRVIYVTCRVPALYETTITWLASHGYPCPESVRLCTNYKDKYLHAHEAAAPDEPILLIDDQAEQIVRAFQHVARSHPDIAMSLIPRLTMAAYAPKERRWHMIAPPFPVAFLPSWEQPEALKKVIALATPSVV